MCTAASSTVLPLPALASSISSSDARSPPPPPPPLDVVSEPAAVVAVLPPAVVAVAPAVVVAAPPAVVADEPLSSSSPHAARKAAAPIAPAVPNNIRRRVTRPSCTISVTSLSSIAQRSLSPGVHAPLGGRGIDVATIRRCCHRWPQVVTPPRDATAL